MICNKIVIIWCLEEDKNFLMDSLCFFYDIEIRGCMEVEFSYLIVLFVVNIFYDEWWEELVKFVIRIYVYGVCIMRLSIFGF